MYADDNPERDMSERGRNPFEEPVVREGGVFIEPDQREVSCDTLGEPCAPDDYVADKEPGEMSVPGTADDAQLTFGLETPTPDDEHLVLEGPTGEARRPQTSPDEPTRDDEGELWGLQKPLITEDEEDGLDLEGFSDEEAEKVLEAMGDEAAEPLPDFPEGSSATGEWSGAEHGGFPERNG